MGDIGQKFVFWNLSPQLQRSILVRDARGEGSWVVEITEIAIENTKNLGKDRDQELKEILNEEFEF